MKTEATRLKHEILIAAVHLAKVIGYSQLTRYDVAKDANAAPATISYHFTDMGGLRLAVMQYAVENEILEIIAQGLVAGHPTAQRVPEALKRKALRTLVA